MEKITPPGLTEALVTSSVEKSISVLKPRLKELGALLQEAQDLVQLTAPPSQKIERIHAIRDTIAEMVAPASSCKKGCSHCCKMAVGITDQDAKRIADYTGIQPKKVKMQMGRDEMVDRYMGTVCPFLKKNVCTIYEARPSACRSHFNLSAYPEVCDVINYPGNDVPNLDWTVVWLSEGLFSMEDGQAMGDIREYFPDGADVVESL